MKRWQYKAHVLESPMTSAHVFNAKLNELAKEGWRLVSSYPYGSGQMITVVILERPEEDEEISSIGRRIREKQTA